MRRRTEDVERKLSKGVDQRVLSWYVHMVKMEEERLAKRVWKAEVSRVNGRLRKGWMEGLGRALEMSFVSRA